MIRSNVVLACIVSFGIASAVAPAGVLAGSYGYGYESDEDKLGWAIVSGDNTSMSDMSALDSMDKLKSEYGDEFLYIRMGSDRYVIRDRSLMKRAQDALTPMQEAGREIGVIARAYAARALEGTQDARERARLARRIAKLSGKIARRESHGEPSEELEREREALERKLEELADDARDERNARRVEREHAALERDASKRMRIAARKVNEEMRDILRDAKARRLAKEVD